jgi:hypothetical protein
MTATGRGSFRAAQPKNNRLTKAIPKTITPDA